MDNMQYAEELVREFLVFRGFKNTLQSYETELSTDIGKGFHVDKILELIFMVYVPNFEMEKLVHLLNFLKHCFSSSSETTHIVTLTKLEVSVLRYYIMHAMRSGRKDKVVEFFGSYGNDLLQKRDDWTPWFAIPYIKNPSLDPRFHAYFSKEWYDTLLLSFRNLLSEIFNDTRIPALLKVSIEKNTVKRLKKDIKQLNVKLSELQALLEIKEAQISQLTSSLREANEAIISQRNRTTEDPSVGCSSQDILNENGQLLRHSQEVSSHGTSQASPEELNIFASLVSHSGESTLAALKNDSSSTAEPPLTNMSDRGSTLKFHEDILRENRSEVQKEEEFPEVKVEFQETFLGHTSPITRCRFSAGGTNIASASVDGTVRIWTYDSSTPTSRNATIYCGTEIISLEWECKSDRLVHLMGVLKLGMWMQRELSVISTLLSLFQVYWI